MLRLLSLLLLIACAAPARAQVGTDSTHVDTTLAPYLGAWQVAVSGTPLGVIAGTLAVAGDGTGMLSLTELLVVNAPVTNLRVEAGALGGRTTFESPVSGMTHSVTLRLVPQPGGSLSGALMDGLTPYSMTARRSAP